MGGFDLNLPEGTGITNLNDLFSLIPKPFELGKLKIYPIAFDSLGVRSMATYLETPDLRLFIDPSAALGPSRYKLPPHRLEEEALQRFLSLIKDLLKETDIVVITHYHFDHYSPELAQLYRKAKLYIKHPSENINKSQQNRASQFLRGLDSDQVEIADGGSLRIGNTKILFSSPVPHGPNDRLGYVIEVAVILGDDRFLFTSDVQGFLTDDSLELPLAVRPQLIISDGPPTYFLGTKFKPWHFNAFKEKTKRLISELSGDLRWLVMDHHLLRDLRWRRRLAEAQDYAKERGVEVLSIPELLGIPFNTLEALRKELYQMFT